MALIDQYNLSQDQKFAMRVTAALAVALYAIESEPSSTPTYQADLAWVAGTRDTPGTLVQQLCLGLASIPSIVALYVGTQPITSDNVDDASLQSAVSALVQSAKATGVH